MRDSQTARVLRDELDFILDIDPSQQAPAVAAEFETLMNREEARLLERYRIRQGQEALQPQAQTLSEQWWHGDESGYAWIHISQLGVPEDHQEWQRANQGEFIGWPSSNPLIRLLERISNLGLMQAGDRVNPFTGLRDDELRWVAMHPRMVSVYSCALAARIAQVNSLVPVTDVNQFLALSDLWTADDLGAALLQDTRPKGTSPIDSRASVLYACAAVRAVIPANIEHIPIDQIVRVRKLLSDEFDAFSEHIDAMKAEFALLDEIQDARILQARLESMVERDLTKPTRDLKRGLRALGMDPVRAVFGLKSLELPAVAALAAQALQLSPIAGAGGAITVQLLTSIRTVRRTAKERRNSAAGYLFGVRRELDPVGTLTRGRRALFRSRDHG
jgi:hypothetical protein